MNKVFKSTAIYSLGNVLPQAAAFILLPVYANYLTPSDYGIIESVNALNPIIVVFFTLCFSSSIFRLQIDYKSQVERKEFFGTLFISNLLFSTFFFLILIGLKNEIIGIYRSIPFYPFFFYMILYVFVNSYFDLPQKYLMISNKPIQYIAITLLNFTLTATFILYFLIIKKEGASGYLKAMVIGSLSVLPFYLSITYQIVSLKFSKKIFLSVLKFSLPIIPTLISAWVLNLSDRIFIERYFSIEEVGIYSLAYKIASSVLILVTSFDMAYRPLFFEYANNLDSKEGIRKISDYNYLLILIFFLTTFFVSLFSKDIISILFQQKFQQAHIYIPLIAFSFFFSVISSMIARFFEQSKRMDINMYISLSMGFINIIFNIILIPFWGIFGAIFATIFSFLIGCSFAYWYAYKNCFFVPFKWKNIFITSVLLIVVLIFSSFYLSNIELKASIFVKLIISHFIIGFIFLYNKKLFANILKREKI